MRGGKTAEQAKQVLLAAKRTKTPVTVICASHSLCAQARAVYRDVAARFGLEDVVVEFTTAGQRAARRRAHAEVYEYDDGD
jgi:hypothetical protein